MKDILLAGADTPEQRVKALEQYAAIWGVELDYLYGEWFELAADADKAMVSNAIAMFAANLEMQEYMWSRMYGEGSEEVVTLVTDMVIAQCHDLCALVAGLNGAN